MSVLSIILAILTTLFGGLNIFQFLFLRSTKKEYEAKAEKAATDSSEAKHDYLVKRLESVERLYKQQGDMFDAVRQDVLHMKLDLQEKDQKIIMYETEIKSLTTKVARLEEELQAYKVIKGKV